MPRVQRKRRRGEHEITIVITFTGNLVEAYDAARRSLEEGIPQDHMTRTGGGRFAITNAEVK